MHRCELCSDRAGAWVQATRGGAVRTSDFLIDACLRDKKGIRGDIFAGKWPSMVPQSRGASQGGKAPVAASRGRWSVNHSDPTTRRTRWGRFLGPSESTMKDFKNKVAALTETAALAGKFGVKVTTTKVNVASRDEVYAWADQVVRDHGKVNLIFNNAGVALGAFLETVKASDFEWIMGINFWGVVWGTQAFLPHLKKAGEGHIINTSSLFGLLSVPTNGTYNASKFAVRGYTEALRQELDMAACGVSATCVHS